MVGFTGSRNLPTHYASLVAAVVSHFAAQGRSIATGCAKGADEMVRQIAPFARVFRASAYPGPARARLARRSAAMVRAVQQSGNGLIIGFAGRPCPPACRPRSSFQGHGSGTWGTLALAAGLDIPVIVFWCQPAPAQLPPWGHWQHVSINGQLGWQFVPAGRQASLF